ncbi:hypothetical protein NQ318_023559 [Aromia moschata]|uniref:DDE Tnp4 domain-containing protein n=1 Tax=Aromia moschata TaxID=1265417 RepID=A0AAV8YNU4_9CUCU|nr:hypothetical protein NQ318_023559 [Aromia moschata]
MEGTKKAMLQVVCEFLSSTSSSSDEELGKNSNRYVGNKSTFRQVSSRFNMSESTFHSICTRLLNFLNDISPNVIKFPNTVEEKQQAASEFARAYCRFSELKTPVGKIKSTYVNRHDLPAMVLQGICSSDRKFIDVFTGIPSKIYDARVFKLSFISDKLPQICGNTYHILGDAAYPIRKWLLTPYRDYGNLTNEQRTYNYKFSATRVRIENTFGIFKQRFRQLLKVDLWAVKIS